MQGVAGIEEKHGKRLLTGISITLQRMAVAPVAEEVAVAGTVMVVGGLDLAVAVNMKTEVVMEVVMNKLPSMINSDSSSTGCASGKGCGRGNCFGCGIGGRSGNGSGKGCGNDDYLGCGTGSGNGFGDGYGDNNCSGGDDE